MDNGLIFLYYFLLTMKDGEGYIGRILVTGLNVQGVEGYETINYPKLSHDYEMLRHQSNLCHTSKKNSDYPK